MFYRSEAEEAILLLGNLLAAGALFLWIWFRKAGFPNRLKAPLICVMESAIYAVNLLRLTEMIMGGIVISEFRNRSLWMAGFLLWEGMLWLFFFWRAMKLASSAAESDGNNDIEGSDIAESCRSGWGKMGRNCEKHDNIGKNIWAEWEYAIVLLLLFVLTVSVGGPFSRWAQFVLTFFSLGLFALLLYVKSRKESMAAREESGTDSSLQRREEYQQSVELQYQRTRELWHDLKNHIHVLELLAREERLAELNDYLSSFKRDVEIRMIPMKTGCTAVDALLSDKLYHAQRRETEILLQVCDLSKIMIRPSDLCAVLGNLLDNAMEACDRLSENKKIKLHIKQQENFYYITVINTAGEPGIGGNALASEKKGKENGVGHGLGLRSVERIAHQYGGSLVTDYEAGEFRAIVRMEG